MTLAKMYRPLSALLGIALVVALSACQPPAPEPTQPPEVVRNPTPLPAPDWIEPSALIGRTNVTAIALLGRLDSPDTPSTVFASAVAPDGTRLAALNNTSVVSWDLITGARLFQTARVDYTRLFYSADKTELYAVRSGGLVDVLDAETGSVVTGFSGYEPFGGVTAYDDFNGWLAFGGSDGSVRVWDPVERQARVTIEAHTSAITALAFSGDGAQLASAGADGAVRLWDWAARALQVEIKLDPPPATPTAGTPVEPLTPTVGALAFAPTGAPLAIGTDVDLRLWMPPMQLRRLSIGLGGAAQFLSFARTGQFVLAGNQRTGLYLWTPTIVLTAPEGETIPALRLPGVVGERIAAAFSPDATLLATVVFGGVVSLWDMTQITDQTIARADLPLGDARIVSAQWTPDGRLLLLFDASGSVYAWGVPPPPE
jgi:WD40 repeat protein